MTDVADKGGRSVEELRRLVRVQEERLRAQEARILRLEASLHAALDAPIPVEEAAAASADDGSRLSRAVFLRTAAAGAAGLAAVSLAPTVEPAAADAAQAARAGAVEGTWIVSIAYGDGRQRTRGLATFVPGGGFVGSISAYEQAPARRTPSRGTTLHGTWEASGGRSFRVTAARLHLDRRGSLLGVMTTRIAATLRPDRDTWDGTFTFTAAEPDGDAFSRGSGTLRGVRLGRAA